MSNHTTDKARPLALTRNLLRPLAVVHRAKPADPWVSQRLHPSKRSPKSRRSLGAGHKSKEIATARGQGQGRGNHHDRHDEPFVSDKGDERRRHAGGI
jgi:hypothetical protein